MASTSWRLAESLRVLRDQVNKLSPNRSKVSDGTIGNAEHASRSSDHNPWVKDGKIGIVTGEDITKDIQHGIDSRKLAEALVASRDSRIKYIISDGQICSGDAGPSPWKWRKYTGKNSHHHHVHISVKAVKKFYDDTSPWRLPGFSVDISDASLTPTPPKNPVLALNTKGIYVEKLQKLLLEKGYIVSVDADFGPKTEAAVKTFQKKSKLLADGVVGPYTWEKLEAR